MEEEADLYDEQVGDVEIGPEIVDEALHPSAVGRGVVQLDGVALPLEPEHGGERPSAGGEGGARPGDGGLVERLPLGPHPDPRAADRSRHEPKHERGLAGAGVLEEAVRERHGGAEAAGLVRVDVGVERRRGDDPAAGRGEAEHARVRAERRGKRVGREAPAGHVGLAGEEEEQLGAAGVGGGREGEEEGGEVRGERRRRRDEEEGERRRRRQRAQQQRPPRRRLHCGWVGVAGASVPVVGLRWLTWTPPRLWLIAPPHWLARW